MKFALILIVRHPKRGSFGLPDVEAFNQALVEKAQEKVFANMQDMDRGFDESLGAAGAQMFEAMQSSFFTNCIH